MSEYGPQYFIGSSECEVIEFSISRPYFAVVCRRLSDVCLTVKLIYNNNILEEPFPDPNMDLAERMYSFFTTKFIDHANGFTLTRLPELLGSQNGHFNGETSTSHPEDATNMQSQSTES